MKKNCKILYVEDDVSINTLTSCILDSKLDVELLKAHDGQAGLEMFKSLSPDIILTDIKMPRMTGTEMIEEIRKIDTNIPIVVITAYNDIDSILSCVNLKIDGFITKPIKMEILLDKLKDIINRIDLGNKLQEQSHYVKKFHAIIERSPIAIAITGIDFEIEYTNIEYKKEFCANCKHNDSSKQCYISYCPEYISKEDLEKLSVDNDSYRFETEIENNNNIIFYNVYANPIEIFENLYGGFVFIIENITPLKAMQRELIQFHRIEAVGYLAGGIAHEFNNILTAIIGYASAIILKNKDEKISNYANRIIESSEKASELTNNILAFSRKDIIRQEFQPLNLLIRGTEKTFIKLAGEKIKIKIKDFDKSLMAFYDLGSIEQVLYNIVKNAVESIEEEGEIEISIDVERLGNTLPMVRSEDVNKNFVVISVSDTGRGMDDEILSKAFDPFFTTKKIGEGPGLGLSISYGIMKQNNGYLTLASEPCKGTVAKIFLPMSKV